MLDLRAKGGPIGRQFEKLYAAGSRRRHLQSRCRIDKTRRLRSRQTLNSDPDQVTCSVVAPKPRPKGAAASAFVLTPLDALVADEGVIAALRKSGNSVTAVAAFH